EASTRRSASLVPALRPIATRGTGVLPQGYVHPDLVNRFTLEGVRSARHVLDMCVRALDYMPPVEAACGDFLRAVLTADADLAPEDDRGYRVAFADAFRSYGIGPAEESTGRGDAAPISAFVRMLAQAESYWHIPRERKHRWRTLQA